MKRLCVVYNPASGRKDNSEQSIRKAFEGLEAELTFIRISSDLAEQLKAIKTDVELLVAAGGDGTVNAVAQLAVDSDLPMGVLPIGTLNHFAKDIGMPLDMRAAAEVIVHGTIANLDYASVNDQVFVNNSSIGVYPNMVIGRERLSDKVGKWPAAMAALVRAIKNLVSLHLEFELDDERFSMRTPVVFIGNNNYHLEQTGITNRTDLTGGELCIYIVRVKTLSGLMRLAFLSLLGKSPKHQDFVEKTATRCKITSTRQRLHVSFDGEVKALQPPLRYAVHAAGLQVCTPGRHS